MNIANGEYTPDEFLALQSAVESKGGAIMPERCEGTLLTYKEPKGGSFKTRTCTCNQEAIAVIPYEVAGTKKQQKSLRERGAGFARVCLVCDAVGAWPTFEASLED